jgi:hypothetical protein
VADLRAYLDSLDEQTRRPGEPPLREAVAQQARERLAELDARENADLRPCPRCGHACLHTAQRGCDECACDALVDWLGPVALRRATPEKADHNAREGT